VAEVAKGTADAAGAKTVSGIVGVANSTRKTLDNDAKFREKLAKGQDGTAEFVGAANETNHAAVDGIKLLTDSDQGVSKVADGMKAVGELMTLTRPGLKAAMK
jgi:hypothetical protein